MTHPRYTDLVQSLPASVPFVGPETQERQRGAPFLARLGANENGFGPSPRAIAALQEAAHDAWMYGEPESYELRNALATHLGVTRDNIVVGEGIDGLLCYLVRLLVGPGDAVVTSDGAYPTFNYHVAGFGGTLHKVPYRDDKEDPEALLAKAHETGAKLIYLANPDNPMGTWHSAAVIEQLAAELPGGCVLALDEAYVEFAPEDAVPNIAIDHPAVLRLRTFSKGYGLAGIRVGYGFGATEFIKNFDKIRNHFGMSRPGQAAALAALHDTEWLETTKANVSEARARIARVAERHGLQALASATNFVAIDCGRDGAYAREVLSKLIGLGVFARMPFVSPQDRCIRISCGPSVEMDILENALSSSL